MATGVAASVVLTPGNKNFSQTKRFVVNYVQGADDAELLDIAGDEINGGIDRLNTRVWNWNLKYQDITFVASTASYSISSDHKKPRKLHLLDSSSKPIGVVGYSDPKSFWDEHSLSDTDGTPERYTIESPMQRGAIVFDPTPSTEFVADYPTARLHYYARVQHLTQDADVMVVPPEAWAMVAWYARWSLALIRASGTGVVDRAFAHWSELEQALIRDDRNLVTDWNV